MASTSFGTLIQVVIVMLVTANGATPSTDNAEQWQTPRIYPVYTLNSSTIVNVPSTFTGGPVTWLDEPFSCGLANGASASVSDVTRIVGGAVTSANEFPWQAFLISSDASKNKQACGGSFIGGQWILTAAHCVSGESSITVYLGAQDISDILGASSSREPNRKTYVTREFYVHPNWNADTLGNDVALVKLPINVTSSTYIRPVCLPSPEDPDHAGDLVTLTGWGKTSDSSGVSTVLRKTTTTVISNDQCGQVYGNYVTSGLICSNGAENHGTCSGDSGGPMNFRNPDGTWTVIGVVSFGSSSGCLQGYPNGFTRVRSYLPWISSTMNSYNSSPLPIRGSWTIVLIVSAITVVQTVQLLTLSE